MPAEITLADGTRLTDNDPNIHADDILEKLDRAARSPSAPPTALTASP